MIFEWKLYHKQIFCIGQDDSLTREMEGTVDADTQEEALTKVREEIIKGLRNGEILEIIDLWKPDGSNSDNMQTTILK